MTDFLYKQVKAYSELEAHLKEIIGAASKIHTDRALIDFTDHGIEHSNRVLEAICGICSGSALFRNTKDAINSYEAFILLSAVYLHDIGMQLSDTTILHDFSIEYNIPYEEEQTKEYIRKNHHLLSCYWIRQNINQKQVLPLVYYGEKVLGEYVELVVESHGLDFLKKKECLKKYAYRGTTIRLDLLCVLLSLGDALDCDCRRIDYEKLKYSNINPISKMHRLKHYYVNSVNVENRCIQLFYQFPQTIPSHERKIYQYFFSKLTTRWIHYCFDNYGSILKKYNIFLNIEEFFSFSTAKDRLSKAEYTFIEEKAAEMIYQDFGNKESIEVSSMCIAIGILIIDSSVLLVRRKKKENLLEWQFPAGIIKPSEKPAERMAEEFQDETGISVEVDKFIGTRIHPNTKALCFYYLLKYVSGSLINGDEEENSEAKWIPVSQYKEYIASDIYYKIELYLKERSL